MEEIKAEVSLLRQAKIWATWSIYIMGLLAIWAIIQIQFLGKEFTIYNFGFQNRPELTQEQRDMFAEEAEARSRNAGAKSNKSNG